MVAPHPASVGINNLLVLLAFYLYAADGMKTRVTAWLRHPQLTAFSLWAFAHLLVNGDMPGIVLFGGLLVWALVEMVVINRAVPVWNRPRGPFPARKEAMAAAGAVIVTLVVGMIHGWLFWYGDILVEYACVGAILFFARKWPVS